MDNIDNLLNNSNDNCIGVCLFTLKAIRNSFDPVPECLVDTIGIVEWVGDLLRDYYDSPEGFNNQ